MSILSDRAMLSRVNIRQWTARKYDRKITDETNAAHGAKPDAGRYNKSLISRDALAEIVKVTNQARGAHYHRTLPWTDDGTRILPTVGYLDYARIMATLRSDFDAAVQSFVAGYDGFREAARVDLNGMFNASDYPDRMEIAKRFHFAIHISPVPTAGDFRAAVGDDDAAAIRADIEARAAEALDQAMRDTWSRIAKSVGHMVERLNAYQPGTDSKRAEGVFRDTLVENIRELVDVLPSLNITGDPSLTEIVERMKRDLCANDADELRDNVSSRKNTAEAAAAILADVSDYLA